MVCRIRSRLYIQLQIWIVNSPLALPLTRALPTTILFKVWSKLKVLCYQQIGKSINHYCVAYVRRKSRLRLCHSSIDKVGHIFLYYRWCIFCRACGFTWPKWCREKILVVRFFGITAELNLAVPVGSIFVTKTVNCIWDWKDSSARLGTRGDYTRVYSVFFLLHQLRDPVLYRSVVYWSTTGLLICSHCSLKILQSPFMKETQNCVWIFQPLRLWKLMNAEEFG